MSNNIKESKGIKWPRIVVSNTRHAKLAKEAKNRKMSIVDVAEEKFRLLEKKK